MCSEGALVSDSACSVIELWGRNLGKVWSTKSFRRLSVQVSSPRPPCWQDGGGWGASALHFPPQHKVGRCGEVSSLWQRRVCCVTSVLSIRNPPRTAQSLSVFFCCSVWTTVWSPLNGTVPFNADWCAVRERTAELQVPLDFSFKAKRKCGHFLPFSSIAMELTCWSIVLLGCTFLHWTLLVSAEEGEWFKKKKSCLALFFCGCMAEWAVHVLLHPATHQKEEQFKRKLCKHYRRPQPKSQGGHRGDRMAGCNCSLTDY